MGLFNFGFDNEGPGVDKNAPEKKGLFQFIELFFRKIGKYITLNILYMIINIPLILGVVISVWPHEAFLTSNGTVPPFYFTGDIVGLALMFVSLFIIGPANTGYCYILRNFAREEHAWVFADFFGQFKKNYKQGFLMSLVEIIVPVVLYCMFVFYGYMLPKTAGNNEMLLLIANICRIFTIFVTVFYIMMHKYIYIMIVTFDLKFKQIIKNAAILTMAKLPYNLIIFAVQAVILALAFGINFTVGVGLSLFILISLIYFIDVFSGYSVVDKYMMSENVEKDS